MNLPIHRNLNDISFSLKPQKIKITNDDLKNKNQMESYHQNSNSHSGLVHRNTIVTKKGWKHNIFQPFFNVISVSITHQNHQKQYSPLVHLNYPTYG